MKLLCHLSRPFKTTFLGLLNIEIQRIFSGENLVLRSQMGGGGPPLLFSCLHVMMALQKSMCFYFLEALFRLIFVTFQTCHNSIFGCLGHLLHASCTCSVILLVALQSSMSLCFEVAPFQHVFGHHFPWHNFVLGWFGCFLYAPCTCSAILFTSLTCLVF